MQLLAMQSKFGILKQIHQKRLPKHQGSLISRATNEQSMADNWV
jgi:hypothetical protein